MKPYGQTLSPRLDRVIFHHCTVKNCELCQARRKLLKSKKYKQATRRAERRAIKAKLRLEVTK